MTNINEARFSGTVEQFKVVQTRTGTSMIRFSIACNKERITVVAFKALADATRLIDGEQVSTVGAIQSTSWTAKDGTQRYGFQVIASAINGTEQAEPTRQVTPLNKQMYEGGPF